MEAKRTSIYCCNKLHTIVTAISILSADCHTILTTIFVLSADCTIHLKKATNDKMDVWVYLKTECNQSSGAASKSGPPREHRCRQTLKLFCRFLG